MLNKIYFSFCACLFAAGVAHAQGYGVGTPLEAKKMVKQAIEYLQTHGEEEALQEFNKPNGKFQWRDLYVFAYDDKGVMRAHPNPKLIGLNVYKEPDSRGKLFRKEIVDIANSRGSGWVDYTYKHPMTQQEEVKITYFERAGNLIVCCGAYLP